MTYHHIETTSLRGYHIGGSQSPFRLRGSVVGSRNIGALCNRMALIYVERALQYGQQHWSKHVSDSHYDYAC
jgi:hypothetical protein